MVEDSTSEFSSNGEVAPFNDPAAPLLDERIKSVSPIADSTTTSLDEGLSTKYTTWFKKCLRKLDNQKLPDLVDAYRSLVVSMILSTLTLYFILSFAFQLKSDINETYESEAIKQLDDSDLCAD